MGRKKESIPRTKKIVKRVGLASLALYGASQLAYFGNNIVNGVFPSEQRAAFDEQHGFPIVGYLQDIEESESSLSQIVDVLVREQAGRPFELDALRIRDSNFFRMPFWDQLEQMITNGNSGYYSLDNIVISDRSMLRDTLHHEIKHAKTFDIIAEHPEFKEKWMALARDENGESLYLSGAEQACSRIRGLGIFIDDSKTGVMENEALGFVSNYARTNIWEDIAELGENVERDLGGIARFFQEGENYNKRIVGKVRLAEEYGLIPNDTIDFLKLRAKVKEDYLEYGSFSAWVNTENIGPCIEMNRDYLKRHPDTIFSAEILGNIALAVRSGTYGENPLFDLEQYIDIQKERLEVDYKGHVGYICAIDELKEIYRWRNPDVEKMEVFSEASKLYWKRFRDNDPQLPIRGVNDFLIEKGILTE